MLLSLLLLLWLLPLFTARLCLCVLFLGAGEAGPSSSQHNVEEKHKKRRQGRPDDILDAPPRKVAAAMEPLPPAVGTGAPAVHHAPPPVSEPKRRSPRGLGAPVGAPRNVEVVPLNFANEGRRQGTRDRLLTVSGKEREEQVLNAAARQKNRQNATSG